MKQDVIDFYKVLKNIQNEYNLLVKKYSKLQREIDEKEKINFLKESLKNYGKK